MAGLLRKGTAFGRSALSLGRRSIYPASNTLHASIQDSIAVHEKCSQLSGQGIFSRSVATDERNAAAKELYNRHRQIMILRGLEPYVAVDAWVAPNATVIGSVEVQDKSTVWYGCVLRGDLNAIVVEPYAAVLERTVIHAATSIPYGRSAETVIGKYSVVGPQCTLRSCRIADEVVIGQRSVVMEGSIIEKNSIVGEGSVLPPGSHVPPGQLWAGNPARFVRNLTEDEVAEISKLAERIQKSAAEHSTEFLPYSTAYIEVEKLQKALAKS
eukprot:TRINITY_DN22267_c0_g1_i1.p1 TRINITY_DN22267_c0_g1~~TRINITY_DN22267_c0_g1_i1.p1  ORF type:complete len:270 (-),score=38.74 TRINITY_DN22267_c0_g1_i1:641-1450(-)